MGEQAPVVASGPGAPALAPGRGDASPAEKPKEALQNPARQHPSAASAGETVAFKDAADGPAAAATPSPLKEASVGKGTATGGAVTASKEPPVLPSEPARNATSEAFAKAAAPDKIGGSNMFATDQPPGLSVTTPEHMVVLVGILAVILGIISCLRVVPPHLQPHYTDFRYLFDHEYEKQLLALTYQQFVVHAEKCKNAGKYLLTEKEWDDHFEIRSSNFIAPGNIYRLLAVMHPKFTGKEGFQYVTWVLAALVVAWMQFAIPSWIIWHSISTWDMQGVKDPLWFPQNLKRLGAYVAICQVFHDFTSLCVQNIL